MKHIAATALAIALFAPAASAQDGDAAAGEKAYNQCKTCHAITDADGNDIVKGGKAGPNLYGVVDRQAGVEDFKYSSYMVTAGEQGLVWTFDDFSAYVQDPSAFLKDYLGDDKARGKMSFKLRKEEQAADIWAYLVSVGPESEGGEGS